MAAPASVFVPVEDSLAAMIGQLQADESRLTDLHIGSALRNVLTATAVAISNQSAIADQLNIDAYLDTATGVALDAVAANWLVIRLPAVQAAGTITVTRQDPTGDLVIPAAFAQLATAPPAPGINGVAVVTSEDAVFADGDSVVTVTGQAVIGGRVGNLSAGTVVIPLAGVAGVASDGGFVIAADWSGGWDAESDDRFRQRVPLVVQGRVKGIEAAFLAGALGVPGVDSAAVMKAGDTRGDATAVGAGHVEVYYQGSPGLVNAVQSAITSAATLNQDALVYAAESLAVPPRGERRLDADVVVYYLPGADTATIHANIVAALLNHVSAIGCGGTLYQALAVEAMLAANPNTPGVAALHLPLTTLNLHGVAGPTDLAFSKDAYPALAASDIAVTLTSL